MTILDKLILTDIRGSSSSIFSALEYNVEYLKFILNEGHYLNISTRVHGELPLHFGLKVKKRLHVREMCKYGGFYHLIDSGGNNGFHILFTNGSMSEVESALNLYNRPMWANLLNVENRAKWPPLLYAIVYNRVKFVKEFLDKYLEYIKFDHYSLNIYSYIVSDAMNLVLATYCDNYFQHTTHVMRASKEEVALGYNTFMRVPKWDVERDRYITPSDTDREDLETMWRMFMKYVRRV